MYIERTITLTIEDRLTPQQEVLRCFTPEDDHAYHFLRLCKEDATSASFIEREQWRDQRTLLIATMKSETPSGRGCGQNDIFNEGWRFASLAHWYHYLQRVAPSNETFALCGDIYRDETFEEWIPVVTQRNNVFGRKRNEITMKHRGEYLRERANTQWLIAMIVEKKE